MRTQAEWNVETHMILARLPTSSSTRSFISAAALLVKVIARIEPGCALRSEISQAIRRVSTRVLPEPAPATTSSGRPSWTTAAALRLVEACEQLLAGGAAAGRALVLGGRAVAEVVEAGEGEGQAHLGSNPTWPHPHRPEGGYCVP